MRIQLETDELYPYHTESKSGKWGDWCEIPYSLWMDYEAARSAFAHLRECLMDYLEAHPERQGFKTREALEKELGP